MTQLSTQCVDNWVGYLWIFKIEFHHLNFSYLKKYFVFLMYDYAYCKY